MYILGLLGGLLTGGGAWTVDGKVMMLRLRLKLDEWDLIKTVHGACAREIIMNDDPE